MGFENFAHLVQKKMKESKKKGIQIPKNYPSIKSVTNDQKKSPKKGCCGRSSKY